jgi:hypothetical protein
MGKGSGERRPLHHIHGRSTRRHLAYCLSVQQKAHVTELNDHQCNLGGRFRCLLLKSLLAQACPTGTMSIIGCLCESNLADDISTLFRLIVILQRTCENDGCVASSTARIPINRLSFNHNLQVWILNARCSCSFP